ncbi:MAG: class I SAM-dependent methyltransferase [Paenibacillaceae bacterium]|nr:class I SAM-dependent methyltransferase [Paenibacillaceae bacterium]
MPDNQEMNRANVAAWNDRPYAAWLNRHGTPAEAAARIARDPASRLGTVRPYLGELRGKRAINPLGSFGGKAVAMALLGAEATVVDIAEGNARYARELAEAAGVPLRYIVADVLALPEPELTGKYDIVLMEFGILHYFLDLAPLMTVVFRLLAPGGRFALQDFHPFTTKLIESRGTRHTTRKHKISGDYFDDTVHEAEVPYGKFLPEAERTDLGKVRERFWTLGEIVTSAAEAGLVVKALKEEPNQSSDVYDRGIPKSFTLIADKPER